MTQQWGSQGSQPGPNGQQWAAQPNWNRPAQSWNPPGGVPPQFQQPQYPVPQYPGVQYPPGQYPPGQYPPGQANPQSAGAPGQYLPQARFGQPGSGQPGGFAPPNSGRQPGGQARGGRFRGLLLGLVLVIGIGFFAISLTHYLGADVKAADRPTVTPTTAPPVKVPAPDFNPPPVPQPETYEEAQLWLRKNAAYSQSVPIPTDCQVPGIDLPEASVAQLTEHLNDLTGCLWRVWSVPLEAAGFELPRPPVTIYNEPITTPCGDQDDVNAFYCAADQHIYYAKPLYRVFPESQQRLPFVADAVLAHEFGHTIQARTGIMISSIAFERNGTKAEGRVFSRRLEVQADCFAGMFTSAVGAASGLTKDDTTNLRDVIYSLGDDVLTGKANYDGDHGLGKSRKAWFTTGQENTQLGKCNTYTVPATAVR